MMEGGHSEYGIVQRILEMIQDLLKLNGVRVTILLVQDLLDNLVITLKRKHDLK